MTVEHRNKWKCQECVSREPKTDNTNTPIKRDLPLHSDSKECSSNVTLRSRAAPKNQSPVPSSPLSPPQPAKQTIESELVNELRLFREEIKAELRDFKLAITDLTAAVNICNKRVDDLAERVEIVERFQRDGSAVAASSLQNAITELKLELNDRDQELLRNDIEIAGIPEQNHERYIHLALTAASKLGVNLEERDIVSVERAGPVRRMEEAGSRPRPRPIVVRLARRAHRDQLLEAARVRRGVTTAGLGVDSDTQRFYVNERLTHMNRQLFYKARGEALRAHWKYVWTREGKIFVRKEHGSPRHRIRSDDELDKFFGQ